MMARLRAGFATPHHYLTPASVAVGFAAAWFGFQRRFINVDGVSYLDMADAYLQGGWQEGANAYWSPLYPWLLAGAVRVIQPGVLGELAVAQLVNATVFLITLGAFIFFWSEANAVRRREADAAPGSVQVSRVGFSGWAWWVMGYALFLWASLRLIKVWTLTPDMLVLASVLAAGGLLLRMRRRPDAWHLAVALGVVLGLGYLAKAVMFPLGLVFVLGAWGALGANRRALGRAAMVAAVFAVVALPYAVTLSAQLDRLTFGDAGRLNYARYVNGVPDLHWQGDLPGHGTPRHATRQISSDPAMYEFAEPVGGTYPVWYDPAYWYNGIEVRMDAGQQIAALVRTGRDYVDFLLLRQGAAAAVVLLLFLAMGPSGRWGLKALGGYWFLWLPAVAAFGLYALVYVEPRYVAPFLFLLWGSALAAVRLPDDATHRRLLGGAAVVVTAVFALNLAMPNDKTLRGFLVPAQARTAAASAAAAGSASGASSSRGLTGPAAQRLAARALAEAGVAPGEHVAFIGYSYDAYWARLAGLRIVAELPYAGARSFWEGDAQQRAAITDQLFAAGTTAIVTLADSRYPPPEGWRRLGETAYYIIQVPEG
jgi:hypothetical protein